MPTNRDLKKRNGAPASGLLELKQLDNTTIQAAPDLVNTFCEMGLKKDLDVPSTVVTG